MVFRFEAQAMVFDISLAGRLLERLAGAELTDDTRLLEFAFEFLQRTLDVLTFFDLYDNHCLHLLFLRDGKGRNNFLHL